MGTVWWGWSVEAGPVGGRLMALEVLTAFVLGAGFVGVMVFGMRKVGEGLHFFATCMVALGTLISATWIMEGVEPRYLSTAVTSLNPLQLAERQRRLMAAAIHLLRHIEDTVVEPIPAARFEELVAFLTPAIVHHWPAAPAAGQVSPPATPASASAVRRPTPAEPTRRWCRPSSPSAHIHLTSCVRRPAPTPPAPPPTPPPPPRPPPPAAAPPRPPPPPLPPCSVPLAHA